MGQPSNSVAADASGIGVLDKAVTILAAVAVAPRTLADLVEGTGLPRATAHRLAVALEVHRLVARDVEGRFVLGSRLAEFAAALPDPVVAAAAPVLAWVRDECGESAQLYRREGSDRVCVAAAERLTGLRTTVPIGSRLPLTGGSGAQVIGAWDPGADGGIAPRKLAEVRSRGWAQSVGEREAGVASVSAPVFAPDGSFVGAISISGPIERLGRSPGAKYATVLIDGASKITASL
jgi:DNA-binding IclR family transcriptional regulator